MPRWEHDPWQGHCSIPGTQHPQSHRQVLPSREAQAYQPDGYSSAGIQHARARLYVDFERQHAEPQAKRTYRTPADPPRDAGDSMHMAYMPKASGRSTSPMAGQMSFHSDSNQYRDQMLACGPEQLVMTRENPKDPRFAAGHQAACARLLPCSSPANTAWQGNDAHQQPSSAHDGTEDNTFSTGYDTREEISQRPHRYAHTQALNPAANPMQQNSGNDAVYHARWHSGLHHAMCDDIHQPAAHDAFAQQGRPMYGHQMPPRYHHQQHYGDDAPWYPARGMQAPSNLRPYGRVPQGPLSNLQPHARYAAQRLSPYDHHARAQRRGFTPQTPPAMQVRPIHPELGTTINNFDESTMMLYEVQQCAGV